MDYPLLIVRTPRAGRFNHATLLPAASDGLPAGFDPAEYVGVAAGRPVGVNYMAAVREVSQADNNRVGREVLVLAGVRPPADPRNQAAVSAWLEAKLEAAGEIVAAIDWGQQDERDLVCHELADWRTECVAKFGLAKFRGDCSHPLLRRPGPTPRWLIAAAVVVVAAGPVAHYARQWHTPAPPDGMKSGDWPGAAWGDLERRAGSPLRGDAMLGLAASLRGVGAYDPPGNYASLGLAEQRAALLKCGPFRDWLAREFGGPETRRPTGFTPYLGGPDAASVAELERAVGTVASPADVFAVRRRMRAAHRLLADLRGLPTADESGALAFGRSHIFRWVSEQRRDATELPPPPEAGVPFLTPREVRDMAGLLKLAEHLKRAVEGDIPLANLGKPSLFAVAECRRLRGLPDIAPPVGSSPCEAADCPLQVVREVVGRLRKFPTDAGEEADPDGE